MRRSTRLGLALLVLLLLLFGAYSAYWRLTAGQLGQGFAAWAQAARAQQVHAAWKKLSVGGYPFSFRVELTDAEFSDGAITPPPRLRAPLLAGSARPWNIREWRLAAADGLSAEIAGMGGHMPVAISARQATGKIAAAGDGGSKLSFDLEDLALAAAAPLTARSARLRIELPARPPRTYSDPDVSFSVSLHQTKLPVTIEPLGATIADLDFAVTIKGPVPQGALPQVAAQWRDAGGTIELDALRFRWGGLQASATGTLAFDHDLQPVGGFSGAVEGYDQIIAALVAQGSLPADKAGLARLALTMLAKAGPDGKPEIATSFTIQNGKMYLGPAPLGKAPHIDWR
ncbi:MAG TPA: DUF2125 domain-containing protein [Stellaceae bacterium]|nr:DUF2125 domain-containing protein [Stellaceae bacterium]